MFPAASQSKSLKRARITTIRERRNTGVALSLSGGGYRAMLFHIGALWRFNELGYLKGLKRISSVSGGSITAGMLGLKWAQARIRSEQCRGELRDRSGRADSRAGEHDDRPRFHSWRHLHARVDLGQGRRRLSRAFVRNATLQDLPDDASGPRFVINATSVQTGALFRFSRPYIADYHVGRILNPTVELAVAVAASSAFPPILSPCTIEFDPASWITSGSEDLHRPPFTSRAILSDGGVYDNLGLETTWKRYDTILVSNGGGKMAAEESPHSDWARHAIRINDIIDNQVRSLRARQVIDSFTAGLRKGTYWGIRTDITAYAVGGSLLCPLAQTTVLAETPTRLKALPDVTQDRLINWGYAVCDAGMRKHVATTAAAPANFPYRDQRWGRNRAAAQQLEAERIQQIDDVLRRIGNDDLLIRPESTRLDQRVQAVGRCHPVWCWCLAAGLGLLLFLLVIFLARDVDLVDRVGEMRLEGVGPSCLSSISRDSRSGLPCSPLPENT